MFVHFFLYPSGLGTLQLQPEGPRDWSRAANFSNKTSMLLICSSLRLTSFRLASGQASGQAESGKGFLLRKHLSRPNNIPNPSYSILGQRKSSGDLWSSLSPQLHIDVCRRGLPARPQSARHREQALAAKPLAFCGLTGLEKKHRGSWEKKNLKAIQRPRFHSNDLLEKFFRPQSMALKLPTETHSLHSAHLRSSSAWGSRCARAARLGWWGSRRATPTSLPKASDRLEEAPGALGLLVDLRCFFARNVNPP